MKKNVPLAHHKGEEVPALIVSIPASVRQRRIAFGAVVVLSVVFAVGMPFATMQAGRVDAFLSVIQTVVLFADLITALFLFAQFSIHSQRALLALASGYIVSGLFALLQALDFPGANSAIGIITVTPSGAVWRFFFLRTIFPLAVIAYVLLKDAASPFARLVPGRALGITIACVVATTAGLAWLVASGYLPSLYIDATRQTPLVHYLAGATWLLNAIALVMLFIRTRTILDVWLIVPVSVSLLYLSLAALFAVSIRFSVGWYMGKIYMLIGSWTVLVVLLWESMMLYARLSSAMILRRRESANRLMSVDEATAAIAHEINQPLGAVSLNCETALECLKRTPLDLEELRSCLMDAIVDGNRASDIIAGIRGLFKTTVRPRTIAEINRLVREVLRMVENDLRVNGVSVSTELQEDLPQIIVDPTQVQQVILNLIKNSIEAMTTGATTIRALRLVTTKNGNSTVSLLIQDGGPGITPKNENHIFDPFFTTKSSGMGLGLSISRRMIEDHGGDLRLIKTSSNGTTFEVVLPV